MVTDDTASAGVCPAAAELLALAKASREQTPTAADRRPERELGLWLMVVTGGPVWGAR